MRTRCVLFLCFTLIGASAGCAVDEPMNPSFALTVEDARGELDAMERGPVTLDRPVVVLNGWADPGLVAWDVVPRLKRYTGDERIISVSFAFVGDFETCRERLIAAVDEAYPSDDPVWTREVDVVAYSMGGLVARYAALSKDERVRLVEDADAAQLGERRLRIARLFTIATPHRGANMAPFVVWDRLAQRMKPGSTFITKLDGAMPDVGYELYPYARLGDSVVGAANAAPPGRHAWWVPNFLFSGAHTGAHKDPRILADIAARLRGEPAFTQRPAAPLPEE